MKNNNNYFLDGYFQKTKNYQQKKTIPYERNNLYSNANLINTVSHISNNYPLIKQSNNNSFKIKKKILNNRNSYDISKNTPKLYYPNTQKIKINEEVNQDLNNDSFGNSYKLLEEDDKKYYNNYNFIKSDRSDKSEKSDDGEPDPRINFEAINKINKSRPLTSYGGLNVRKKNLEGVLEKYSRPCTSYNINSNL